MIKPSAFLSVLLASAAALAQQPAAIEAWPSGDAPFGCRVWPVVQGAQATDLGHLPAGGGVLVAPDDEAFRAWAEATRVGTLVPVRLQSALARPEITVFNEGGPCRPRLGSPTLVYEGEGHPEVAYRLSGCGAEPELSRVAFEASCGAPAALRYTPFEHRIRRLAARGAPREPQVTEVVARVPAFVEPRASAAAIQRRYRVSQAFAGGEEWLFVEVHARQNTSSARCPNEAFATGRYVREGSSAWSEVRGVTGSPLGVFHDGRRVIAIVTSEMTEGPVCRGGAGCEVIAVYARGADGTFTRAQALAFQVRTGNPVPRQSLLQQGDRMCDAQ